MSTPVPYLSGISRLIRDYDGFVLDLWGVIHDGIALYPDVVDCLARMSAAGKRYVMLSNAPRRSAAVVESMIGMGMPAECCRHVMSSGEAVWQELRRRGDPWYAAIGRRCYHIGPARDEGLFKGLDFEQVGSPEDADLILNTGPWRDDEQVADYEDRLRAGAAHGVPMLCANPDLVVIRGGRRIICAGTLAERYEALGGAVRYLGKPHPEIYAYCFAQLGIDDHGRILAIGDSLRTDIAGAAAAGIDSALVIGGIHADEFGAGPGAAPDEALIGEVCGRAGLAPKAALPAFVW